MTTLRYAAMLVLIGVICFVAARPVTRDDASEYDSDDGEI
jgi:hypothetical protein